MFVCASCMRVGARSCVSRRVACGYGRNEFFCMPGACVRACCVRRRGHVCRGCCVSVGAQCTFSACVVHVYICVLRACRSVVMYVEAFGVRVGPQ